MDAPTSITWLTDSTSVYDAYGRVTDASDVRGNHTLRRTRRPPADRSPAVQTAERRSTG